MKVDFQNNRFSPSYRAIRIARTKGLADISLKEVELYRLYRGDRPFLQKLAESVSYKKLMPALSRDLQDRWQKILNYCITRAFREDNSSYIFTSSDKICGIMTYHNDYNVINLDGVCSIPIDKNERVKRLRKTMFYQLFKDANESNMKGVHLDAITDGPFDLIAKYEELGFREDKKPSKYISMFCNKHKIAEQLRELPFEIEYIETGETKHRNLIKLLI